MFFPLFQKINSGIFDVKNHTMRIILPLFILLLLINIPRVQANKRLKVLVTKHGVNKPDLDHKIQVSFKEMIEYVRSKRKDFPYTDVEIRPIDYHAGPGSILKDAIATITPLKYIKFQQEDKTGLIPILITQKRGELTPYFSAILISSARSKISSIHSDKIKKVYFVDSNSTSGYMALMLKLRDEGIIDNPTLAELKRKGWNYEFCGGHRDVEERVCEDTQSIGAVWTFTNWPNQDSACVNVLLRYEHFPQDPLVISKNLEPFKEEITDWLLHSFINDEDIKATLSKCMDITGFVPFRPEHENAFVDVYNKFKKTKNTEKHSGGLPAVFTTLMVICSVSFIAMFYFAVRSIRSAKKKKTFASLSWGSFTAFLLVLIEILRLAIETSVHHNSYINTVLHENSYFITIGVGIVLASLAEFKNKFATMICRFLRSIIVLLEAVIEIFQRKESPAE